MRFILAIAATILFAAPAMAASQIECSQIPHAQSFINGLKPGPNTKAAQRHLDMAKKAKSDKECVAELGKVNYYAKRSAAADKHAASAVSKPGQTKKPVTKSKTVKSKRASPVACADTLHQNRPGGSDYKGPPVPSCKRTL